MHRPPDRTASVPLVSLRGISRTYRRGGHPVRALHEVDLDIATGEFTAVMGPSGSGKSTLLHIVGLLDADYSGTYRLSGRKLTGCAADDLGPLRNREIGFVFQTFHLLPRLSILDNAALPALYAGEFAAEECRERARIQLERMGLGARLDHRPGELSVGQRQRAAIARALVNSPSLILGDEPTGALDSKAAREILDVFADLHGQGSTIVLVTHDPEVAEVAERVIHVRDGQTFDGLA